MRTHARSLTTCCVLLSFVAGGACTESSPRADLVLHNARIYTLDWPEPDVRGRPSKDAPWDSTGGWHRDASALAVTDGRISYVGTDTGALALAGPSTRVIDLAGAVLLPGMVDAHTHVAELGAARDRIDLTGVATEEEAIARVVERARSTPKGEWILGWGWDEGAWADRYPDKRLLGERVPDHPVILRGLHGFAAWANERALAEAGITAGTPPPVGGEIRLDAEGAPSGLFLNRAVELMDRAVPLPPPATRDSQLVRVLQLMAESGYTGVHEAGTARDVVESLLRLDAAAALPIRVYVMLDGRDSTLLREWGERGPRLARPGSNLVIRAVKAYYDGALGSRGAQLLGDYSDRPGHRGVSGEDYGFDRRSVAAAMAAGFQVGIHAIGDAGNRTALDFIDSVGRAAPASRDLRHRIEHAQVVNPIDQPRFGRMGVIASMQPPHAVEDMPWAAERLGPVRLRGAYAWRTMREAGARVVFSSDLPGSDWNLFYGWNAALRRQDRTGKPPAGWIPGERMTEEEVVRGYSSWAAYAAFDEQEAGTIAVGKRADLTAVSVDPFGSRSGAELRGGAARLVVVEGKVVWAAP